MTLAEMQAIAQRARDLEAALSALRTAEERLALLNAMRKENGWTEKTAWQPSLTLRERKDYGPPAIEIRIAIPFGVVQQQLVYAVEAARRKVIKLGGTV